MPLKVVVVRSSELYERLREYERLGYSCRAEEDGDWECSKPINELMYDIHILVVV